MKFAYFDFMRIYKSCVKAVDKNGVRKILRYIELRASNGYCVASALDGFVMNQVRASNILARISKRFLLRMWLRRK